MTLPCNRPYVAGAIAVGSVAAAMILRSAIDAFLDEPINYGTFYLAIIVTALHCGRRWGLASLALAAATAALVLPPLGRPTIQEPSDLIGLALFLVVSAIIVWLCDRVRQHRRAAEAAAVERQELLMRERAAREEAERLNRVKDGFLAAVSHELRMPLQSILGWSQLLQHSRMSEEQTRLATEAIERSVRVQTQLINDLLDMSRIVMGKMRLDLRPIAVADSLQAAVQTVLPTALAKGVHIDVRCDCLGPVLGDPDRLQQIIWNLLSNAIKFTPAGGSVVASLRLSGPSVVVEVADTGAGISAELLPHVFERFRQGEGKRRREGLGLGLAIVKELAELHGGTVTAHSDGAGRGARMAVALPKHRPLAVALESGGSPATRSSVARAALAGRQVLVVDDDAEARGVLKTVLRQFGAEVLTAESATEARELLLSYRPDVITCDLDMPGDDGFDFVRRLREEGAGEPGPPVVAVTACGGDGDRCRVAESGFQGRLVKPVELGELASTLAEFASPDRPR